MKNETVTASNKQTYETPELSVFGQIEDLTQGAGGVASGDAEGSV